jgi:hypothetical protein
MNRPERFDIGWLLTGKPTTPKVTALEEAAR